MEAAGKFYITHNSRLSRFKLYCIADIHMMSKAHSASTFARDIATIRDDPYAFWFGGGDYADYIGYTDKRFDPDAIAEDVSIKELKNIGWAGMKRVRAAFEPIKGKCLGLLLGNHEKKYELAKEHDGLHAWLCTELEVANFEYSAFFDVVFSEVTGATTPQITRVRPPTSRRIFRVRVFAHHGAGYAQTKGGKLNKLLKAMKNFEADLVFMAHVHEPVATPNNRLGANRECDKIENRRQVGVITGSYLKTYAEGTTTYGEQKMYDPVELGAKHAIIIPGQRHITAEI